LIQSGGNRKQTKKVVTRSVMNCHWDLEGEDGRKKLTSKGEKRSGRNHERFFGGGVKGQTPSGGGKKQEPLVRVETEKGRDKMTRAN